ncbi:class I SAM-dependent methyltransferase [Paenibacillus alvei]|uniref:class I SAM-dependent methyltransferase n=1 Tax=Paenibacillus alvei TaxID=44250 RepID=UPI0013DA5161|nr:class I SAM-dependent methyltransferase [Paenibacillus alvei]NEZ45390.1 class I SAM-dependent methyltransferase [Paenibacillus alvei]
MQEWKFFNITFEYEHMAPHVLANSAWVGHRSFAYDLVTFVQPKIVVELGTHWGASFYSFCQAVKDNWLPTVCYAVDTWQGDSHSGSYKENVYEEVKQLADTLYPEVATLLKMTFDEALPHFEDDSIQLLHIDGFHEYEAVRHDFETWLLKLAENGIVLFHDIAVHHQGFGVWKFWDELKAQYPSLEFQHSGGLGVLFPKGILPVQRSLITLAPLFKERYSQT